jgi:dihydroflavonol-4-reductase
MMAELNVSGRALMLVTGASGFLGAAIANSARAAGYRVRVLIRSSSPRTNIHPHDEVAVGDLRDRDSIATALRGVRYLVHAAADYRLWAPSPDEMLRNNVEGTRTVMEEALRAGVERIVYTSSVATLALDPDGTPATERDGLTEERAIGAYKRSKVAAERVVQRMVAERGLPAVIVNPSTPIGPRDIKPTPTGRIIVEAASGRMPGYVDTSLNFVHVDDVAAGHLAAFERGRVGELYILGGQNASLANLLGDIARIVGRRPPWLRIPRPPLYPLAWLAEAGARVTGREPFVTLDGLRMAKYRMVFSSAKAEQELGYRARPYGEGLAEAIDWFRKAGKIT